MNGAEFIDFAYWLVGAEDNDSPRMRTAVSRGYYGAFHLAKELLEELGFPTPRTGNAHVFVQRHFSCCSNSDVRRMGRYLNDLHRDRLHADYQLQDTNVEKFAEASVELAVRIRKAIETCRNQATLSEMRHDITAYQKIVRPG